MSTKSLKMLFKAFILPFYFIGEIEEKRPGGGKKGWKAKWIFCWPINVLALKCKCDSAGCQTTLVSVTCIFVMHFKPKHVLNRFPVYKVCFLKIIYTAKGLQLHAMQRKS